jgi:Ca2+-binding RTX toxin-like protein
MSMFLKNARKWSGLEKLEDRITPDVTFAWELNTAPGAAAQQLFFRLEGDDGANEMLAWTDTFTQNIMFAASFDEGGGAVFVSGSVSAGEIALAQFMLGKSFGGLHVLGNGGHDVIDAGEFATTGDFSSPLTESLTNARLWAEGGTGNDLIAGGFRADYLQGQDGNDTLVVAQGVNDLTSGGTGGETGNTPSGANWFTSGADLLLIGPGATATGGRTVVNTDIERIVGSKSGETIDNRDYEFSKGSTRGVNVDGADGNDTIISSAFGDLLNGNTGTDTISYVGSVDHVNVNISVNPHSTSGGDAQGDSSSNFENVRGSDVVGDDGTGATGDNIIGSSGANTLDGGAGDDTLNGLSGNDTLLGRDGEDAMDGGLGNDVMAGGNGNDQMEGGLGNDTMAGDAGDDTIDAGAGTDTININWDENGAATPNPNDAFFGGPTGDIFRFFGITFTSGNPVEAEVEAIFQYLDDQLDAGMADWDETLDSVEIDP